MSDVRVEGGLEPMPVPRSWVQVWSWYDRHGGNGARELAEAFTRAAKGVTTTRTVTLQKAAGACVWLAEHENAPLGSTPSVKHYQRAWASVLGGIVLEVDWTPPPLHKAVGKRATLQP